MTVILKGLVGSKAYGLDTPDSDDDWLGVFLADICDVLGLANPKESRVTSNPDCTLHELHKYCRLGAAGNPTILELLWLEEYDIVEPAGQRLIDIREAFLSQKIRNTYGGYARQQFNRLLNRGDGSFSADTRKRSQKHARHMFRLLEQGRILLETGRIQIRVEDPERLHAWGKLDERDMLRIAEQQFNLFDNTPTRLPENPNYGAISDLLFDIRLEQIGMT